MGVLTLDCCGDRSLQIAGHGSQIGHAFDGPNVGHEHSAHVSAVTFPGSRAWLSRHGRMASAAGDKREEQNYNGNEECDACDLSKCHGGTPFFWCARVTVCVSMGCREQVLGHHWMRTLAQARTGGKNLVGGLLVPLEVI